MIIHKLLYHYLRYGNNEQFCQIQTNYTIKWLEKNVLKSNKNISILDLGCGNGILGKSLMDKGYNVTFSDKENRLLPRFKDFPFKQIDLNDLFYPDIGKYDLIICSNVLEHLSSYENFLKQFPVLLKPNGKLYLSWTNWLSPFGGHEFVPFHYLGPRLGSYIYRIISRKNSSYDNKTLFVTSIGKVLNIIRNNNKLKINLLTCRYYPEFSFISKIPVIREFLSWNCAMVLSKIVL